MSQFTEYKSFVFEIGLMATFVCWLVIHVTEDIGKLARTAVREWFRVRQTIKRLFKENSPPTTP